MNAATTPPSQSETLESISEAIELHPELESISKAITLSPGNATLYMTRAKICTDLEQFPQAISDYRKVLSITPDCMEAHLALAEIYEKLGHIEHALLESFYAFYLNPEQPSVNFFLGRLLQDKAVSSVLCVGPGAKGALFEYRRCSSVESLAATRGSRYFPAFRRTNCPGDIFLKVRSVYIFTFRALMGSRERHWYPSVNEAS